MFIIFIIGRAAAYNENGQVTDPAALTNLNGIEYNDVEFTEFLCDANEYELSKRLLKGGGMYLSYKAGEKVLTVTTTYHSRRELNDKQIERLGAYTLSQWTDGIGEGLETESPKRFGYRIVCLLENQVEDRPYPRIKVVKDD
jgi:hypothetical protein